MTSFSKLETIIKERTPGKLFIATMGTLADLMMDVIRAAEVECYGNDGIGYYRTHISDGLHRALSALRAAQEKLP